VVVEVEDEGEAEMMAKNLPKMKGERRQTAAMPFRASPTDQSAVGASAHRDKQDKLIHRSDLAAADAHLGSMTFANHRSMTLLLAMIDKALNSM
jgi:hypothetical protein